MSNFTAPARGLLAGWPEIAWAYFVVRRTVARVGAALVRHVPGAALLAKAFGRLGVVLRRLSVCIGTN